MVYDTIRLPSEGGGKSLFSLTRDLSGTTVYLEIHALADISGDVVSSDNPLPVNVSGVIIQIQSGQTIQLPTTQVVQISGQGVFLPNTQVVNTSGQGAFLPSTQQIQISGQGVTATVTSLTTIKTGAIKRVTGVSGGVVLFSGVIKSVTLKALDGEIYVGGSGNNRPYSGYGFILDKGEGTSLDVNNFDAVYVCAPANSGDRVSFLGVN